MKFLPTAQEEAEKINTQTGAGYVTDQSFWEERGIITGEDLALSVLGQTYSDFYKEVHGVRPRHAALETVEEYTSAIDRLDDYYNSMIEQEELDVQQHAAIEKERQALEELMPGEFDFDHMPPRSGMGRRVESKSVKRITLAEALGLARPAKRITNKTLRSLILSEMRILLEKEEGQDKPEAEGEEPAKVAEDLEGAFSGGPEGVRAFMDSKKDEGVVEILSHAAEEYDGDADDDKITIDDATPKPVSELGPTQQFIDLMQSVAFPLGGADELNAAIGGADAGPISTSGEAVLDGHHRWSGTWAINPQGSISVKSFNFPGGVREKLAAAQMAVAAVKDSPGQPSKGGGAKTNIIGKSTPVIFSMIDANKGEQSDKNAPGTLLNDKMIQSIADGDYPEINTWAAIPDGAEFVSLADSESEFANDPIRKAIADKVATNLGSLKKTLPGAPSSREDMPQLDHPDIGGKSGLQKIEKGLPVGEFNVVPPFTKEAVLKNDRLIMERWNKLAGIL